MSIPKRPCPNCKSSLFTETVSREYCPACKLEFNYHGVTGGNKVYLDWEASQAAAERRAAWDAEQKWLKEDEDTWFFR